MNNLQDLIAKLQQIEEADVATTTDRPSAGTLVGNTAPAPAAATDARAQYDQFKADDAKKAAIETVKKYMSKPINQIGRLENLIDPATGFIYYGQAGMDATKGTPTKMPTRFMSQGDQKSMMDAITAAGLKVVDSGGYAMIDPASLKTLGQAPAPAPAPAPTTVTGSDQKPAPTADADKAAKVKRFTDLLTKAGVMSATTPTASTVGNVPPVSYNLATGTGGPGIKLPPAAPVKESITFKSTIGALLAESGALDSVLEASKPAPAAPALSKEEYSELSKLYGDLSVTYKDDPALAPLFAAYNKVSPTWSPSDTSATSDQKPVTPSKPKVGSVVNPGTRAYQNWLNSQGVKVAIDGSWGPETQGAADKLRALKPKEFGSGAPRWQEMMDMIGVGAAHNVKPSPGHEKDYVWLNSPRYLEAMKKYGYDPKTGNPVGGAKTATAPSSAAPATGSDQKAAPVASTGNPNLDVLNTIKDPKQGQQHWVNGQRFAYRSFGFDPNTGKPNQNNGWYKNLDPNDKLIWNTNQPFTRGKYTGPDDDASKQAFLAKQSAAPAPVSENVGYTDESLERLVSLVQYR